MRCKLILVRLYTHAVISFNFLAVNSIWIRLKCLDLFLRLCLSFKCEWAVSSLMLNLCIVRWLKPEARISQAQASIGMCNGIELSAQASIENITLYKMVPFSGTFTVAFWPLHAPAQRTSYTIGLQKCKNSPCTSTTRSRSTRKLCRSTSKQLHLLHQQEHDSTSIQHKISSKSILRGGSNLAIRRQCPSGGNAQQGDHASGCRRQPESGCRWQPGKLMEGRSSWTIDPIPGTCTCTYN